MSWWESRMEAEVVVNVDGILFGMPLPTMSSLLISFPILWQENSLSTSWMYLVGVERLATSCLLARRSLGCVGSPRVFKIQQMIVNSRFSWLMVISRSSKENGLSNLVKGRQRLL
ncbi:uncharacterized protein [Coffea arabica]|uniref:Uncharacterized protein isoform X1 n=1 Tax=Coffea arabica TaxID=13443 RepID=A0ABM4W6W1_COFAR|nr:uncharacterized protein LOC113713686 [Coffea arabica]